MESNNTKAEPIKAKAQFYAVCFAGLQEIAKESGYNLIMHGSMHRDMDLVAVPWIDEPCTHIQLLHRFCKHLGVFVYDDVSHYMPAMLPGGRQTYVINLNRGGKFNGYSDEQWYLDISITPLLINKTE